MPIGSLKTTTTTTTPKSDKSAAASSSSSGPGGGGRTTFRPPWVKADVPEAKPKTTIKTTAPWVKKTTTTAAAAGTANDAVKKNGEAATPSPVAKVAPSSSSSKPAVSKIPPVVLKPVVLKPVAPKTVVVKPLTEAAPPRREAKLQSREIKVPIITEKRKPVQEPLIKPKPKKPPTPSESEEEESSEEDDDDDDSDDETETESESEEDSPPPKEAETELERKFQEEKPKMRPIVVKRDKSLSCTQKKRDEEDDDEAEEGETEEDRERRRRFKLDRPKLRHVVVNKQKSFNKSVDDFDKIRPVLKKVQKVDEVIKEAPSDAKPEFKDKVLKKVAPIKKDPSKANVPAPPPLPSLVPKPPPPPPPPLGPPADFEKKSLNEKQKATIEKLKTRPRRRPDWSEMMKEVEEGKKLRHVQCNDRSQPIITCKSMTKVDDKFVYETEKDNAHNKLLKQIQGGIRLKSVKTNDRSKPFLDGLRKFRRQMTIEEQIQKSESKATLNEVPQEPDEPSGDELDDIDKLRDDLQSTKQMLALELRNREAQERENKRLLAKIANLEAEMQRDKTRGDKDESSSVSPSSSTGADDVLVESLKKDAEEARKTSKELEKKYEKSAEELDAAKNEVEEQKRMIQQLEKKLSQALQQSPVSNPIRPQFSFCYSFEDPSGPDIYYNFDSASETDIQQPEQPQTNNIKHISNHIANVMNSLKGGGSSMNGSRRPSEGNQNKESSPELELEMSESEDDEDEEKKAERKKRRLAKEVKILQTKLTKLKDKQEAAKRERANLKQIMKKNHVLLKEENKKFKKLEKEVHKMAASMKEEVDDDEEKDDDEGEEEEEEAEEEQESEEESEESESEESEEGSGSETESESEAEDASDEDKKSNLEPRVKKHENRLSALKKGNVLLQANVDNLQDEISKVREKASSLQAELDSVLADLGL